MKNQLLLPVMLAGFFFSLHPVHSQQVFNPDSSDFAPYNIVAFTPLTRTVYSYNNDGDITALLQKNYNLGNYTNSTLSSFTYDGNGNNTEIIQQNWVVSAWVNDTRTTMTYNGSDDLTQEISQVWNISQWENSMRTLYTYDINGRLTEQEFFSWNTGTNQWDKIGGNAYEYNVVVNDVVATRYKNWNGSQYVYTNMDSLTYALGSVSEKIYLTYQGGNFVNATREANIAWYNEEDGEYTSYESQTWNGSFWDNSSYFYYYYDANGLDTTFLAKTWDANANMYVNATRNTNTYYPNGQSQYSKFYAWNVNQWDQNGGTLYLRNYGNLGEELVRKQLAYNNGTMDYDSSARTIFYYPEDLGTNAYVPVDLTVFPNPATEIVQVKIPEGFDGELMLSVIDMQGKVMMVRQAVESPGSLYMLPVYDLPAGQYLIRLHGNGFLGMSTLVKS